MFLNNLLDKLSEKSKKPTTPQKKEQEQKKEDIRSKLSKVKNTTKIALALSTVLMGGNVYASDLNASGNIIFQTGTNGRSTFISVSTQITETAGITQVDTGTYLHTSSSQEKKQPQASEIFMMVSGYNDIKEYEQSNLDESMKEHIIEETKKEIGNVIITAKNGDEIYNMVISRDEFEEQTGKDPVEFIDNTEINTGSIQDSLNSLKEVAKQGNPEILQTIDNIMQSNQDMSQKMSDMMGKNAMALSSLSNGR